MPRRIELRKRIAYLEANAADARAMQAQAIMASNTELSAELAKLIALYERQLPGCRDLLAMLERNAKGEPS